MPVLSHLSRRQVLLGLFGVAVFKGTAQAGTVSPSLNPNTTPMVHDVVSAAQGTNKNVIHIDGKIARRSWQEIADQAYELDTKLPRAKPLILVINSYGGDLMGARSIVNILQAISKRTGRSLTTIAGEYVASAALDIFMAGDERFALPDSKFLQHYSFPTDEKGRRLKENELPPGYKERQEEMNLGRRDRIWNAISGVENINPLSKDQLWTLFFEGEDCRFKPEVALEHGFITGMIQDGKIIRAPDLINRKVSPDDKSCPGWGSSRMMPSPKPVFDVR